MPHDVPLTRNPGFIALTASRTIAVMGSSFGRIALSFGVLALPDASPGRLAVVLTAQTTPLLVLVLLGGVVADRFSRSRLVVISDGLAACAWVGLSACVATAQSNLALLAALAALTGVAEALSAPALAGLLPDVVEPQDLQQANAVLGLGRNVASVVGLAISGAVITLAGPAWALAVNGASFALSGLLVSRIHSPGRSSGEGSAVAQLRAGAKAVLSREWLWVVIAQFSFVVAAISAMDGALGPLIAKDSLGGAAGWAVLLSAQGLGTVVGAGIATRLRVLRPVFVATLMTFVCALPMVSIAVHAPFALTLIAMFATGVSFDVFDVLWVTTIQLSVPPELISRVTAFDYFGSLAFAPLGMLVAGAVATAFGPEPALLGCAAAVVLSTVAALASRDVRTHAALPLPVKAATGDRDLTIPGEPTIFDEA